ncbi:hypothetical protein FHW69_001033 [Luteibacter sp. Sphag1AF]|uniref:hypothetical protein n=1 Tax=Luteibacter sp. Sphag1AF TaxID=2587031 RepID=UPI00160F0709|nr:hypothetical protein [Luteibacter sp. Sphag1AF]MBB3226443.1 hypothetical protein [Luteibacter sp. Sphag1AF]
MNAVDDNTFDSIVDTDHPVLVVFGNKNNSSCTSMLSQIDGIRSDYSNITFNFCDAAEDVSYDYYIGVYASSLSLVMFKGGKNVD